MKAPHYCKTFVSFYHITRCHNQSDVSLIANTITLLTMAIILKVVTVGLCGTRAPIVPGPPDFEVSRSHSDTPHSVGCLWTIDQFVAETTTWKNIHHSQQTDFFAPGGIRTHNPSKRAAADPRLRRRGNRCRKVECNVVPVNNMKSLNGTRTHNFDSRWWWLLNFTPRPLYPLRKISRYQLNRILGTIQNQSARFWKEEHTLPSVGDELRIVWAAALWRKRFSDSKR